MKKGQCKHFNGAQNKLCERGVLYEQFRPGVPCIKTMFTRGAEKPWPYPSAKGCPFYEEPTTEEAEKYKRETALSIERTLKAMVVLSNWKVKPAPIQDRFEVVGCPICGGKLSLHQSSYNGHGSARCQTEGCVHFIE